MKQLDLPFKIDKQYENWQFELDALEDRLNGYHSYKYIGKKLNCDYLTGVIITLKFSYVKKLNTINHLLVPYASKQIKIDELSTKFKVWRIMYYTTFKVKEKEILIIYGKPRFIQKHLLLLH